MSWYSEYRNEWKEIIEAVARECKRAELMVEKDTVQSMFLLELSKIDLPFVFKGGTSLSKAYNRIDRFYESDYRNVTQKLLYEDISYDYAIENGIAVVAESDVFLYKKK